MMKLTISVEMKLVNSLQRSALRWSRSWNDLFFSSILLFYFFLFFFGTDMFQKGVNLYYYYYSLVNLLWFVFWNSICVWDRKIFEFVKLRYCFKLMVYVGCWKGESRFMEIED
ncbi:hypothetical protein Ddye_009739 [Dipteronia dyeriana]|uniref:Uncharacterized protein n=1 Tax=Dipteronia dyeriana TaxID=168575 RepID=A0AAD9XCD7_9ROSI|nr:hypothetical protein Ddye_009739 [Dipteronia dyeriana]